MSKSQNPVKLRGPFQHLEDIPFRKQVWSIFVAKSDPTSDWHTVRLLRPKKRSHSRNRFWLRYSTLEDRFARNSDAKVLLGKWPDLAERVLKALAKHYVPVRAEAWAACELRRREQIIEEIFG